MLVNDFITQDGTHILVWNMVESIEDILCFFPHPEIYETDLKDIKTLHRKKEFLFSRYLVCYALNKQVKINYTTEGKPFLADNSHQISISHSKEYICIALHPTLSIGVDIECFGRRMERVKQRFLNTQEMIDLESDIDCIKAHFYWSAKEAIYKVAGKSAIDFRNDIHIFSFNINSNQSFFEAEVVKTKTLFQLEYFPSEKFVLVKAREISHII